MANQKIRSMKVYEQSGRNYKPTPTIIIKGDYLRAAGFDIGDYISVSCEDGRLVITPDTERAALVQAEKERIDREMERLVKKYETEKKKLRAQVVAERGAEYI